MERERAVGIDHRPRICKQERQIDWTPFWAPLTEECFARFGTIVPVTISTILLFFFVPKILIRCSYHLHHPRRKRLINSTHSFSLLSHGNLLAKNMFLHTQSDLILEGKNVPSFSGFSSRGKRWMDRWIWEHGNFGYQVAVAVKVEIWAEIDFVVQLLSRHFLLQDENDDRNCVRYLRARKEAQDNKELQRLSCGPSWLNLIQTTWLGVGVVAAVKI